MVRTWIANTAILEENERYERYRQQVPAWRREKADRICVTSERALSIGAWVLWQRMQQEYRLSENTVFNLSHSGNYAMCSCSVGGKKDTKVGCDIQKVEQPQTHLAERFFCTNEYRSILSAGTPEEEAELFYRYWVLKESFAKATRRGLGIGLDRFEIRLEPGQGARLVCQPEEIKETYYYKEYMLQDLPYKMAVCSTENTFAEEVQSILL